MAQLRILCVQLPQGNRFSVRLQEMKGVRGIKPQDFECV